MRARVSLVLAGLGKFVVLTSAFCIGMAIAITGPPTASETAGVRSVATHIMRRVDSAALHFTFDLCERFPVAAHTAGVCANPAIAVARVAAPAHPVQVSAVSEHLPVSVQILPPDTIDQIAHVPRQSMLLGEGRSAPSRAAHVRPSSIGAARPHTPRATTRRSARVATRRESPAHARSRRERHRISPPPHVVRATPVAVPRPPAPARPTVGPPPGATPPISSAALADAPGPQAVGPAPEEVAPDEIDSSKPDAAPDDPPEDDIKS